MHQYQEDALMTVVLLDRFRLQRLPVAQSIKQRVDDGHRLGDYDIDFLVREFADAQQLHPLVARHPELAHLVGKISYLYKEIADLALENEKRG